MRNTQSSLKICKGHVFVSEKGLKSEDSEPQAGMHYEMILFHQQAAVSTNQLQNINRFAFTIGLKFSKLSFNWLNCPAVPGSGSKTTSVQCPHLAS